MRAVVLRGPGELAVEDVADPTPGAGELVLRVTACGICGTDVHLYQAGGLPAGSVPGHEFCGEVMETAHGFTAGDPVCSLPALSCGSCRRCRNGLGAYCESQRTVGMGSAPGAFAEYVAVAAHETVRLPSGFGPEAGALVEPLAVALHAARVGKVRSGEHCVVLGAGPIGLGALLWARHFGAEQIIVSDPAPGRRALAERLGATATCTPADLTAVTRERVPNGPDVVIEAVGAPELIQAAIETVGFRGRVIVAGVCLAPDTISPLAAITREATVQFVLAYEKDDFQYTIDALDRGRIDPFPMVTGRTDLAGVAGSFAALAHPSDECKILFLSDSDSV
jgi:(R,R)-butanediol dehydrogenase/meso-butanediol dehydrogenase/diacetyl reductase